MPLTWLGAACLPAAAAADLLGDGELLHSASRDTKVAVDGGADEGDGSGQQHHMGGADLADLSSEGEPDGVVDADAGSTLEEQQQQLEVVGGLGADADAAAAAAGGDGEAGDPLGQPQQRSPVPPPPPYDPNRIYSSATIYAVRNGNGAFSKFYYKFKNVRLTKKFLYFHMPPGESWRRSWHVYRCTGTASWQPAFRLQAAGSGALHARQLRPGRAWGSAGAICRRDLQDAAEHSAGRHSSALPLALAHPLLLPWTSHMLVRSRAFPSPASGRHEAADGALG